MADPETATDNDTALTILAVGEAYAKCKRRHADLATWVRGK